MGETAVTTSQLDHFFGSGEARKQAIFDINLTLERGKHA